MMCNYYESNAERYAAETFSANMSKQYQRFLPLLKNGARFWMWEAAADEMHVISRNRDIRSQHWKRRRISAEKSGKFFPERLYVPISRIISRRNGTMGSGRVHH